MANVVTYRRIIVKFIHLHSLNGTELPTRVGSVSVDTEGTGIGCAVIDQAAGYAYLGTLTSPGMIITIALNGSAIPTRVGSLTLNDGEDKLATAVIDGTAGYAYFGTSTSPGMVVKIALNGTGTPTRIGALELSADENFLVSSAIDPSAGFAYLGTYSVPSKIVKISLHGAGIPTRVGALSLHPSIGAPILCTGINPDEGYCCFASEGGQIQKIGLNGSAIPTLIGVLSTAYSFLAGNLDSAGGYAYVGTCYDNPSNVIKVNLNPPGDPAINGILTLNSGEYFTTSLIDPVAGFAYLGTVGVPGRVVKVALNGPNPPARIGSVVLDAGEGGLYGSVIDSSAGFAYFGTNTSPGRVVKVALNGSGVPTRVGTLILNPGEHSLFSAAIDPSAGYAYFGTYSSPGIVVKIALNGSAPPTRVGALTLNAGEEYLSPALIDPNAGYAYFGMAESYPGKIVKVGLNGSNNPIRIGTLAFNPGEDGVASGVIDPVAGYAYFGTGNYPGKVIKVGLNGSGLPLELGSLTLDPGEDYLATAVIDPIAGSALFGTITWPGKIVKVGLNVGSVPTRLGSLTLDAGEDRPNSALIDLASGYAYFLADYAQFGSTLVKIASSEKGFYKAAKITMPEAGYVTGVSFYSHMAAGNLRLSLHSGNSPRGLLWESGIIPNSAAGSWISSPINSGTPNSLTLQPGDYWLGWQVDTSADVPSYTPGVMGDGLYIPQAFGPAPAQLDPTSPTMTSEKWSTYLSYDLPANDSLLISHTLPAKMAPNQKLLVAITMRNRGNVDWTAPTGYGLAVVNDPCNLFGAGQIPVGAGDAAAPFTNYDFLAQITAPAAEGPCVVRLQMTAAGTNFGPILEHTIKVETPPNGTRNWDFYE